MSVLRRRKLRHSYELLVWLVSAYGPHFHTAVRTGLASQDGCCMDGLLQGVSSVLSPGQPEQRLTGLPPGDLTIDLQYSTQLYSTHQ